MNKINSFKDLIVWQKAIEISVEVYKLTNSFPKEEMFGLISQSRRSSNSISLNIAEGYGRSTTKSYVSFLRIARATLNEVETAFILASKLNCIATEKLSNLHSLILEESKMLTILINKLSKNN